MKFSLCSHIYCVLFLTCLREVLLSPSLRLSSEHREEEADCVWQSHCTPNIHRKKTKPLVQIFNFKSLKTFTPALFTAGDVFKWLCWLRFNLHIIINISVLFWTEWHCCFYWSKTSESLLLRCSKWLLGLLGQKQEQVVARAVQVVSMAFLGVWEGGFFCTRALTSGF